jgi:hypothetical protein
MSDNISSTTFFHFTSKLKYLKSILENGFYPRYCPEYTLHPADVQAASRGRPPLRAIPMVCFCDLPTGVIRKHYRHYGPYGIGLDRDWGLKNGLSPVIYTHDLAGTRKPALHLVTKRSSAKDRGLQQDLNTLAAYSKPYEGAVWRRGEVQPSVKFYDEREWRFVPDVPDKFLPWKEYRNERRREKLQEELRRDYTLKIHPQNVQYLILPYSKSETNVKRLHDYIMDLYETRFNRTEAALVVTTIMTSDALEDM